MDRRRVTPASIRKQREGGNSSWQFERSAVYGDHRSIEVTKANGPIPLEVKIVMSDGVEVPSVPAETQVYRLRNNSGELIVSAGTVAHVTDRHIEGSVPGGRFFVGSMNELVQRMAAHLPPDALSEAGQNAIDFEMGEPIGTEGIAGIDELIADGLVTEADRNTAFSYFEQVTALNRAADEEGMRVFIDQYSQQHSDNPVQFEIVRERVISPVVRAAPRETSKVFLMMAPTDSEGRKPLWTAAPGRAMPTHPDIRLHTTGDPPTLNEESFQRSAKAWFNTVMLISPNEQQDT